MDCPLLARALAILMTIAYGIVIILGIFFILAAICMYLQAILAMRRSSESFTRYMHRLKVQNIRCNILDEEAGLRLELKEWYLKEIEAIDLDVKCRERGSCGVDMGRKDDADGFVFAEKDVEKLAETRCEEK